MFFRQRYVFSCSQLYSKNFISYINTFATIRGTKNGTLEDITYMDNYMGERV